MKTLLKLLLISISCSNELFAQMGINNDGSAPHPSAQLDIKSSTKGLLLPRISNLSNVISPATGLLIFNQNTNTPNYYNGSSWIDLSNGGFTIPYTATATNANDLVSIIQNGAGHAIYGRKGYSASPLAFADFAVVGESNTNGGLLGVTNSGTGTTGGSNTGIGVSGVSNTNNGIFGSSNTGNGIYGTSSSGTGIYGVTGATTGGVGAGRAGFFVNNSPNGYGTGITVEKKVSFKGTYSINPAADMEIRHVNNGTSGLTGLRIFNTTAQTGWTFYTDAQSNLVLFQNNNFIGYFDPSDKSYHASSDSRAKTNIQDIPSILSKINLLSPKYYHYLNTDKGTLGFIAQEVEKIFPALVSKALDGKEYSLNYNGFGVLAVKAIQEQQTIIDDLKANMSTLLKRIEQLENKK